MPLGETGLQVSTNIAGKQYDNESHRSIAYDRNQQREEVEKPTSGCATPVFRNRCKPLASEKLETIVVSDEMSDALDKDLSNRRIKTRKKST